MEDAQIIERFFRREESALHETNRKYHGYCRKIAIQILQRPEDADEVLNDTWLAAWNSIPPHNPENLQTFLGRLTRNIALNKLRSSQAVKRGAGNAEAVLDEVARFEGLHGGLRAHGHEDRRLDGAVRSVQYAPARA